MSDSGTSCAGMPSGPSSAPAAHYPIAATHIDIGCEKCGKCLKLYGGDRPLRKDIRLHKKESPQCFVTSTIDDNFAECARAVEELARRNQSLFNRNRSGDVDAFLEKDEILGYQCIRCNKCFEKKKDANDHVRLGRTQCSGCDIPETYCRKTIFGTLCLAPSACRRQRFELEIATVPMSAAADTETRRSLPMDLPSDEATAGTGSTIQTPAPSRRLA